ncbi:hypothetical protein HY003_00450 [Candidatus Saccharibacteria bacterium]|nr:hypothetical protein [Candidatus Saccharibacteria bacterium]MBI3337758.1 hypothetical protein [Candidatus Saccharibacteria bacterium]
MDEKHVEFGPPTDLPPLAHRLSPELQGKEMGYREDVVAMALEQGASSSVTPLNHQTVTVPDGASSAKTHSIGGASYASSLPSVADDTNLIEKTWVIKAKEIVEKTKDNPYIQNQAMNIVKADYLKKRYGKDIKLSNS